MLAVTLKRIVSKLFSSSTICLMLLVGITLSCGSENTTDSALKTDLNYTKSPAVKKYDPDSNMFSIFSGSGHSLEVATTALNDAQFHQDKSQVPVIIEILRFFPNERFLDTANSVLNSLTEQSIPRSLDEWNTWMVWIGNNRSDFNPPERYLEWKITLMRSIDPRFEDLLETANETSKIDLTEIVWGGVLVDGIPDLQYSPVVNASDAAYLSGNDYIFGVSINGEHRAYPLRILNPHEMANDILGGEHITLTY